MPEADDYREFRDGLVRALRRELIGPANDDPDEIQHEELDVNPLQIYGAGVLFPRKLEQNALEDGPGPGFESNSGDEFHQIDDELDDVVEADEGRSRGVSGTAPDVGVDEQPLNLANEYSPSALGITFRVRGSRGLKVAVSFGTYESVRISEPHPRSGERRADGTPYPDTRDYALYRRGPRRDVIDTPLDFGGKQTSAFPVRGTEGTLELHVSRRPAGTDEHVLSLMLVNRNVTTHSGTSSPEACFFQVEFQVRDVEGKAAFTQIDRPSGSSSEDEQASMNLLYRHRKAFCLGHGCAGDWRRGEDVEAMGITDAVWTATIPTYEVRPVEPREKPYRSGALNLSMQFLSEGRGSNESEKRTSILGALNELCSDYEAWIKDREIEAQSLSRTLSVAATRHMDACRVCLGRMRKGIEVLGSAEDGGPLTAFRLANRAMLMQQVHTALGARELGSDFPDLPNDYDDGTSRKRRWRPFQLAFVLMNVPGAADQDHPDRRIVDLIWFPTGGGKTEAYLGLAAYTICLRRLREPANAGTTVLMRYTLRLLTAQQFQRASALILALESLRKAQYHNADLGSEPISIGLWVGQSLSPNRREGARAALRQMRQERARANNPFQVLHCPWCRCELNNRSHYGYVEEKTGSKGMRTIRFQCPDSRCSWSGEGTHMPVTVIDEDIYESPPTLVLGTVDKFAQVSWDDRTGRLFGIGLKYEPPDLIIQDELHLISGPLGTIIGLYETAIERFCMHDEKVPKIIASTATIRRAHEQCHALYDREAFEFPPQGLLAGDSYFAFENIEAPGRLYVGVLASGLKSHATAQVRTCSALLQHVIPPPAVPDKDASSEEGHDGASQDAQARGKEPVLEIGAEFPVSNPYGTLVWYFNSLRELGYATTMCSGDIPEYLKSMCRRGDVPWDFRRRIRNYVELTSRRTADEIPDILEQLERPWKPKPDGKAPVDILLATNMISVGVDVPRLGLMVVTGQPKSTSEYIQATSRVGRRHPGLVVTIYNQGKSRDRSHYEQFIGYHQAFYRFVEATSITPFSPPARERGLKGVLIALARLTAGISRPDEISEKRPLLEQILHVVAERVRDIDPEEEPDAIAELAQALDRWEAVCPEEYGRMAGKVSTTTLAYPYGSPPDPVFHQEAWPVLTSMRNVDGTAEAKVIQIYNVPEHKEPESGEV